MPASCALGTRSTTISAHAYSHGFLRLRPGSHKTADRAVRFHETFFDDLDDLLPPVGSADGEPSATDFLLHELPRLRDLLADDYESNTLEIDGWDDLRIPVQSGILVRNVALYVAATQAEVLVLSVEIELFA
jgi:hypothetical protein